MISAWSDYYFWQFIRVVWRAWTSSPPSTATTAIAPVTVPIVTIAASR